MRAHAGVAYPLHMYAQFFGLKQEPFSIAPDPRYLFMSKRHREALAHLLYGLNGGGGFVLLSGEIGAGKTTVCRCFLEQIPKRCNVAYIFNPKLTVNELLKSVCDEFDVPRRPQGPGPSTVKDYLDPLNEFLLKTHAVGQNNVLIIDEAQMLSADVLEQLRLLTNLETNERKLLQIVLIGQPELRTMLARPELEQLAQRVVARFHLKALAATETTQYIRHRLAVGGMTRGMPFDRAALDRIHMLARGIPRRINLLCDRAMLGAYSRGTHRIGREIVDKAAVEVFGRSERVTGAAKPQRLIWLGAGLGLVAAAAVYVGSLFIADLSARRPAAASAASAARAPASALGSSAAPPIAAGSAPAGTAASAARPSLALLARAPVAPAASDASMAKSSSAGDAADDTSDQSTKTAAPMSISGADLKREFRTVLRDEKDAWRELGLRWNLDLATGEPCEAAQREQVRCFKSAGTLEFVRKLGRPGILKLHDADNRTVNALLIGLSDQAAVLQMGGESKTVSLVSLAKLWHGDFATFWRVPPGYAGTIGEGDSGPVVDHLTAQLASLAGEPPPTGKQTMNAALRAKITRFQSAHGIKAVGTAGPTTFMQLNRATGLDEPSLRILAP
jgi:general secretion pathway protein A